MYSGFPVTINDGSQRSNTNSFGTARANQYGRIHVVHRTLTNWFGTDPSAEPYDPVTNPTGAYGPAASQSFGTAPVGSERTPSYFQSDASGFKDFHITEGQAIGFRADAFNVFNIASYGNPQNTITNGNFGQINSTRSLPRILQLNLHYNF